MIFKFYKHLAAVVLLANAIPSNTAFSLPLEDNLNLKASMGLATGTVTQKDVGSVSLFAFPLNIGIWSHLATNHSLGLEGNLTFDLGNLQVAKYGLEAAYFYHNSTTRRHNSTVWGLVSSLTPMAATRPRTPAFPQCSAPLCRP